MRSIRFVPVLPLLLVACGGTADPTSSTAPGAAGAEPVTADLVHLKGTVAQETRAALETSPKAVCDVHGAGESESMRLIAGTDGLLRFGVRPDESAAQGTLEADCTATDGTRTKYPFVVDRVDAAEAFAAEAPRVAAAVKSIRPALDAHQVDTMTDDELTAAHYPVRPAAKDSQEYTRWFEYVTKPATEVDLGLVTDETTEYTTTNTNFKNWSGFSTDGGSFAYMGVQGQWVVPTATKDTSFKATSKSSMWVGLDGRGTGSLEQAGSSSHVLYAGGTWTTSYSGWVEYWPADPMTVTGFTVSRGDSIGVGITNCDDGGAVSTTGTNMGVLYFNYTTSQWGAAIVPRPAGVPAFTGTHADWIVERPTNKATGESWPLANYGTATMTGAAYRGTPSTWYNYQSSGHLVNITMSNSGKVLSTATNPGTGGEIDFKYAAHQ